LIEHASFTVSDCPLCRGFHTNTVAIAPLFALLVARAGSDGMALLRTHHLTCPVTDESFGHEIAYYRPYTRVRATEPEMLPHGLEAVSLGEDEDEAIERQLQSMGIEVKNSDVCPI
jgi:hypothetical protein